MAFYFYKAFSKEGKKTTGFVDASSLPAARDQVLKMGLYPIDILLEGKARGRCQWFKLLFAKRVPFKEKLFFSKQLSILLRSGVPLLQALTLLSEQSEGALKKVLVALRDNIKIGKSLADAMSEFPLVFDAIYVQLVRAGEASGRLENILDKLTVQLERKQTISSKITKALMYPAIQLGVVVLAAMVLLVFVVPELSAIFESQGGQLPWPTRFLMNSSDFIVDYYLILIVFFTIIYLLYRYWKSTLNGAKIIDRIKLHVPIVRFFTRIGAVVQFSSTLGMLMESGVNLAESLDIVCKIVDNKIISATLKEARDKIIKQGKITQYLQQTGVFPAMATYLIKTGEDGGQLGHMLPMVSKNYEDELIEASDNLAAKLGPFMLIFMAIVVGFMVMAIMLPMVEMNELAGKL